MLDEATRKIIDERCAATKLAEEVLDLVDGSLESIHARRRFVEIIQKSLLKPQEKEQTKSPEGIPLGRLGAFVLPFGRYGRQPLSEIPLDYLDWLAGSSEDCLNAIRAYLKHPEIRRQLIELESE